MTPKEKMEMERLRGLLADRTTPPNIKAQATKQLEQITEATSARHEKKEQKIQAKFEKNSGLIDDHVERVQSALMGKQDHRNDDEVDNLMNATRAESFANLPKAPTTPVTFNNQTAVHLQLPPVPTHTIQSVKGTVAEPMVREVDKLSREAERLIDELENAPPNKTKRDAIKGTTASPAKLTGLEAEFKTLQRDVNNVAPKIKTLEKIPAHFATSGILSQILENIRAVIKPILDFFSTTSQKNTNISKQTTLKKEVAEVNAQVRNIQASVGELQMMGQKQAKDYKKGKEELEERRPSTFKPGGR